MTTNNTRSSWTCLLMAAADVLWLSVCNNTASGLMRTGPMFVDFDLPLANTAPRAYGNKMILILIVISII